ncbi:MAG TPA: tRNA dihydrouridine synthase DusB [Campylobacterales bacterium]|nr:tRNA dihydrouridine synthase DusB [Campylobacterales bacterium]
MEKVSLDFSKPVYALAPLAGFTDLPFRSVVKRFGADLTVSEMISSNALVFDSKKTLKMITKSPQETPYAVQIAGSDKEIIKEAVLKLNDIEGIDIIDLNAGCPVPKVVKNGAGSALLKDLKRLGEIIETIKKYSKKEYVSVKVRIGFSEKIPKEIAKTCESAGADFIAVHGRTRSGFFKSRVDYEAIAVAKVAVKIPVIANGDIVSYEKAKYVLELTKCDGVMIGRGAIGNPWIFYQLKSKKEDIENEIKREIILSHFDEMINFYGDYGAVMFRKHLHTYSKGYKNSASFRDRINKITNPKEIREEIEKFFY